VEASNDDPREVEDAGAGDEGVGDPDEGVGDPEEGVGVPGAWGDDGCGA